MPIRNIVSIAIALRLGVACVTLWASPATTEQRSFTVTDAIRWQHVMDASRSDRAIANAQIAIFSPARTKFALHLRSGDVPANCIVDRFIIFETADVERYLNGESSSLRPYSEFTHSALHPAELPSDIRWLNENELCFLGKTSSGRRQMRAAAVKNGRMRDLTDTPGDLNAYAAGERSVVYYASERVTTQPQPARAVGNSPLLDVLFPGAGALSTTSLWAQLQGGAVRRHFDVSPALADAEFMRIWLSPSENYAVVEIPVKDYPEYWERYLVRDQRKHGYTRENLATTHGRTVSQTHTRYALINLCSGFVRPLLDAPTARGAFNGTPLEVFWTANDRSVIVTNTYVPISTGPELDEKSVRRPSIVEVVIETGLVAPVFEEAVITSDERVKGKRLGVRIDDFIWDEAANVLFLAIRRWNEDRKSYLTDKIALSKEGAQWVHRQALEPKDHVSDLHIRLVQDFNLAPTIVAQNSAGEKTIYDPNPDAKAFAFGPVERISWEDSEGGIKWQGALLYPRGYRPGKRYPLVVQTHGFDPREFIVDGPYGTTTAMSARAFADHGFLVLQVGDSIEATTETELEGENYARGYKAGIDECARRGLIDPDKVALITWSRTGFYAIHVLAKYPSLLRALIVADAVQPGYLQSGLLSVNMPPQRRIALARLNGLGESEGSFRVGFKRSPLYRLRGLSTPVRLEANDGLGQVIALWETYAVLRNGDIPVDFVYFPDGSHNLVMPRDRLGSQGGSFDWICFWLKDEERKVPVVEGGETVAYLEDQYRRWRKLKEDAQLRKVGNQRSS